MGNAGTAVAATAAHGDGARDPRWGVDDGDGSDASATPPVLVWVAVAVAVAVAVVPMLVDGAARGPELAGEDGGEMEWGRSRGTAAQGVGGGAAQAGGAVGGGDLGGRCGVRRRKGRDRGK